MIDNNVLEQLGLNSSQMSAYWQDKTTQGTLDKVSPSDRQGVKDAYNQAITDLETIINRTNPTNAQVIWAVKRLAEIQEQLLKYLKSGIMP